MAELSWHGKHDKDGKRNGPLRVALPFQTVDTVNQSVEDPQMCRRYPRQRRSRQAGVGTQRREA